MIVALDGYHRLPRIRHVIADQSQVSSVFNLEYMSIELKQRLPKFLFVLMKDIRRRHIADSRVCGIRFRVCGIPLPSIIFHLLHLPSSIFLWCSSSSSSAVRSITSGTFLVEGFSTTSSAPISTCSNFARSAFSVSALRLMNARQLAWMRSAAAFSTFFRSNLFASALPRNHARTLV
ncbi:predicted protein [Micromonas commoda]|uniref:Uncharacterized protein n=1 Tax=Micromonas commoda (strain RCC299 / NOUM17 / CCMP2709) TaxID=296587 RepID=C1E7H5_MICCC|nr:predicted protein [Micromonas commoda]ACO63983.1 predicted protein [Micromonas commoda]|eukprot:XP_002502725.1 predicted protein [Micromonas commoda]